MNANRTHLVRQRPAFTLVELLLSLVLSAFIGSAVLVMLVAATSATAVQGNSRRVTLSRQVAAERVGTLVRASRGMLYSSSDRLLLWIEDRDGNGTPQMSELRLIKWSQGQQRVECFEPNISAPPKPDTSFSLGGDFAAVAGLVESALPNRLLLQHVNEFSVSLDAPDAHSARRVRIQVVLESDQGADNATIITTPRGAS